MAATLETAKVRIPSRKAIQECADWLAYCVKIGWDKSNLEALEGLWWDWHDDMGKIRQWQRP